MYGVFMFSLVAYATLDGFDLGVGSLHLFAKGDNERRLMINAIGPVWDGNSTWIVIGGGVLFAAFPKFFSIIAPNMYIPIMGMLFGFMLRAAAIEFRSKRKEKAWRSLWDFSFFFASLLLAILVGLILGNLIEGVPLSDDGIIVGGIRTLISFYPILVSLFGVSVFTMHGSLYLLMKTEGEFHRRMQQWAKRLIAIFLFFYVATTTATFYYQPHMIHPFADYPVLMLFPLLSVAAILVIPRMIMKKKEGAAFACSCLSIFFLMVLFVIGTFPYLLRSKINPEANSLTFMNSSVSELALTFMAIVVVCGLPLTFFYGSYIHRVFKGKVKLDHMSY